MIWFITNKLMIELKKKKKKSLEIKESEGRRMPGEAKLRKGYEIK